MQHRPKEKIQLKTRVAYNWLWLRRRDVWLVHLSIWPGTWPGTGSWPGTRTLPWPWLCISRNQRWDAGLAMKNFLDDRREKNKIRLSQDNRHMFKACGSASYPKTAKVTNVPAQSLGQQYASPLGPAARRRRAEDSARAYSVPPEDCSGHTTGKKTEKRRIQNTRNN